MRIPLLIVMFTSLSVLPPAAQAGIDPNPVVLVVPCSSSVPTQSAAAFPAGIYAVTVVGVCIINTNVIGSVETVCALSLAVVTTNACTVNVAPCILAVAVDGQCLSLGSAGFVNHEAGRISAIFVDPVYSDNAGTFVVVLQQVN
jgi:hypothetical protein